MRKPVLELLAGAFVVLLALTAPPTAGAAAGELECEDDPTAYENPIVGCHEARYSGVGSNTHCGSCAYYCDDGLGWDIVNVCYYAHSESECLEVFGDPFECPMPPWWGVSS